MEWKKLKNIILLVLLGLNLALGILIGGPALTDAYREKQAEEEAVQFLENKGISMSEVTIPKTDVLTPCIAVRDLEQESRLAVALLGADVVQTGRGGEVYRYTSPRGSIQFHSDGTFWARLTPGEFPVGTSPETAVLEMLKLLEFEGEVIDYPGEIAFTVFVHQMWEGARLFNQQVLVRWEDTGVAEIISASRLFGKPEQDPARRSITGATALIGFYHELNRLGDVCSRVDSIDCGYVCAVTLARQMELTPVWRITTDTETYQMDLVTGALTRID